VARLDAPDDRPGLRVADATGEAQQQSGDTMQCTGSRHGCQMAAVRYARRTAEVPMSATSSSSIHDDGHWGTDGRRENAKFEEDKPWVPRGLLAGDVQALPRHVTGK
jgi:hypothetical protein